MWQPLFLCISPKKNAPQRGEALDVFTTDQSPYCKSLSECFVKLKYFFNLKKKF